MGKREIKNAHILCVGTELLLGDIVNTNAAFLSKQLASLGISVYHHTVVGDNPERLKAALTLALSQADLVIMSGGLGPTDDDLTKETVSSLFGRRLVLREELLASIKSYFEKTGRVMTKNNEKQAYMPEGAVVFENNFGTAPALALESEDNAENTVIMLPGPPSELVPLYFEKVLPYLKGRSNSAIISRNVHIFGMGESAVAQKLDELLKSAVNPTVAPYCKDGEVRLRVTASARDEAEALLMCDKVVEEIKASEVGAFVYGIDLDSMENAVLQVLLEKGKTFAVAESCTGGLIAKRITDLPGASAVFLGGCITYTNEIKQALLGVKKESLDEYTAVSEQVAMEMAKGVRERTGADIGISATGYAGPGGGDGEKGVGTVFLGISTARGESFRRLSLSSRRSREYIRNVSATNAFNMILKAVLE